MKQAALGVAFGALGLGWPARGAEPTEAPAASCPDREMVERAVRAAIRDAPRPDFEVEDLGSSYRVKARGESRQYDDPDRDCDRRARVAAVFIALLPEPAEPLPAALPPPSPPPSPPAPPAPPPRPVPPHPRPAHWSVEAAPTFWLAPAVGMRSFVPGFATDATVRGRHLGANLGVALPFAPGHLPVGPVTASILRYPAHLGVRAAWQLPPWSGSLDAGLLAAVLRIHRDGPPGTRTATRGEWGGRLGVTLAFTGRQLSPYARVFSEWIPRPTSLALEPEGKLADTPVLWLGAALGVELTLG